MRLTKTGIATLLLGCLAAWGCVGVAQASPAGNAPPPSISPIELEAGLRIRPISDTAYVVTHSFPWPANSLLVEMADQTLVLVATPYTPEATRRLLAWARARFGERRIIAINNGFHVDNLGGNKALREAGIPIYGSEQTVRLLVERGERTRQQILGMIGDPSNPAYAAHASIPYVPPDHVFAAKDGLVLKLGAEELRVLYPGPSQAPDKLVVYFPARGLLYGGCMILSGSTVGNIVDADLASWPLAVKALARLQVSVVVPGHGDRLDAGLLQNTLDVLGRSTSLLVPPPLLEAEGFATAAVETPSDALSPAVVSERSWTREEHGITLRLIEVRLRKPSTLAQYLARWRASHACTAKPVKRMGTLASVQAPHNTVAGTCEGGDRYIMHVVKLADGFVELHADGALPGPGPARLQRALHGLLLAAHPPAEQRDPGHHAHEIGASGAGGKTSLNLTGIEWAEADVIRVKELRALSVEANEIRCSRIERVAHAQVPKDTLWRRIEGHVIEVDRLLAHHVSARLIIAEHIQAKRVETPDKPYRWSGGDASGHVRNRIVKVDPNTGVARPDEAKPSAPEPAKSVAPQSTGH